jgi:hypothetical protein
MEDKGQSFAFGFVRRGGQVHMFGHHYISSHRKAEPEAGGFECTKECWGFFRRRSGFFREADHQFCDSDQVSERSDAGKVIVAEVIGIVKQTA